MHTNLQSITYFIKVGERPSPWNLMIITPFLHKDDYH